MKIAKLLVVLFAAGGLGFGAGAQTMSKDAHDNAYKNAESQYKTDKAACDSMSGNAKDVCIEEAKGKEKTAKADADAAFKNTAKAREAARTAHADARRVAADAVDGRVARTSGATAGGRGRGTSPAINELEVQIQATIQSHVRGLCLHRQR